MTRVLTTPQALAGRRFTFDDQGSNSETDIIVSDINDGGVPAPATSHIVFVSAVFGSDTTGDGSMGNPYATIAFAHSTITTASAIAQWVVMVFPGEYSEAVALLPFVRDVGFDPSAFEFAAYPVRITGAVTLDASFAVAGAVSGMANMMIDSTVTLDYVTATSTDGAVSFTNVCITDVTTLTQAANNETEFHNCIVDASDFVQLGGTVRWYSTSGILSEQALRVAAVTGSAALFETFGGGWPGSVHADQNAINDQPVTLNLYGFSTGAVQISGGGSLNPVVNAAYGATPPNPTYTGSSAAALSPQMRIELILTIPSGTVIPNAEVNDVTVLLAGSVLGGTSIETLEWTACPFGAAWATQLLSTGNCVWSFHVVQNGGAAEVHAVIGNIGAAPVTTDVPLQFLFAASRV